MNDFSSSLLKLTSQLHFEEMQDSFMASNNKTEKLCHL